MKTRGRKCCQWYTLSSSENMFKSKITFSYHWYFLAGVIIFCIAWFVQEYVEDTTDSAIFDPPSKKHFSLSPAIHMTGTEFQDPEFQSKTKKEIQQQMDYACEITTNDVVFAFQWRYARNNRSLTEHIFMLCKNHRVFANSIIVHHGKDFILCTEEYGGVLKSKHRPLNVTLKGIDVNTFQHVEYESKTSQESCILQHSVEMLNREW